MVKTKKSWYVKRREQRLKAISKRRRTVVKGKVKVPFSNAGKVRVTYSYKDGKRRRYWLKKSTLESKRNIRLEYRGAYNLGKIHEPIGGFKWATLKGTKKQRHEQFEQLKQDVRTNAFQKIWMMLNNRTKSGTADEVYEQYEYSKSKGRVKDRYFRIVVRQW